MSTAERVRARRPRRARRCRPTTSVTRSSRRDVSVQCARRLMRGVDRLRAVVKEVERPDVVRAAREIDPGRRGGVDAHARIIMAGECRFGIFGATSAGSPSSDSPATAFPTSFAGSSPSSISAASSTSPATSSSRGRWRELSREVADLARDWPLWISVDQEGGRVARLKRAVHRVAAGDHARPERRREAGRAVCARRWRRSCAPSASTSTTRRCSTSTRIRRTPSSAIARWPSGRTSSPRLGRA